MPIDELIPSAAAVRREQLQRLSRRSNIAGALRIGTHAAAICVNGAVIWWLDRRAGLLVAAPFMLLQGWLVAFLFMPLHETAHRTAFLARQANIWVGSLCGVAVMLPYEYYTLFHWAHHRHTQDPERDPELLAGVAPPRSAAGLAIFFSGFRQLYGRLRLMLQHAAGDVRAPWVPAGKRPMVVREARWVLAVYGVVTLGSLLLASALMLWLWLLPLILGQLFLRPYLLAEHSACGHGASAFENTRTTFTHSLVRWFTWNMPYHVEHHAYPSVPFHALPDLHRAVAGRLVHRGAGYTTVTGLVWRWFRAGQPRMR